MQTNSIFLTIRPMHAKAIYAGKKRAELRKSFPANDIKLVFLYETKPVEAVTGAFIVQFARKMAVDKIAATSPRFGVGSDRVEAYFGKRQDGWLVSIAAAIKFTQKVKISELQRINHRFHVPQVFTYLLSSEASSQLLQGRFMEEIGKQKLLKMAPLRKANVLKFRDIVLSEVSKNYEEIDDKFLEQLLDSEQEGRAAFTTTKKEVLEVRLKNELAGFSVLSWKNYGAVKTGPTALFPSYRGFGLGQLVRQNIYRRASRGKARKVYCTCPSTATGTLNYLLNSGMRIEAVLERHLHRDRDEYVLGYEVGTKGQRELFSWGVKVGERKLARIQTVSSESTELKKASRYFARHMAEWYFQPPKGFEANIEDGVRLADEQADVSRKPKRLVIGSLANGRIAIAVLATAKRSDMVKLNIVSDRDDRGIARKVLQWVVEQCSAARRVYCTVPVSASSTICALADIGFKTEGILRQPFVSGSDHMAMGLILKA